MHFMVATLTEYVSKVLEINTAWEEAWRIRPECENEKLEVWYRGHSKSSYELVPGAYRGDVDACSAFHRFRSMAAHVLTPKPVTEWEWYFAAQHYGMPTRLLDWTEDPIVALQFALMSRRWISSAPPVVWIMEAASLNAVNFGDDQVYVPIGRRKGSITSWLPSQIEESEEPSEHADLPAAILPPWSTPRIIAQRGRFTVHGGEPIPIEQCFARSSDPDRRSHIASVQLIEPAAIHRDLERLGFATHRLFPEPEKLAEYLRAS